jgi:nicotinate-nucleotide adenylyltransferase
MNIVSNVGIFGGAFNPITNAHIQIVEEVAKKLNLYRVMFEPINNNYDKIDLVDIEHRINMIHLVFDSVLINGTTFDVGGVDALSTEKIYTYEILQRYKNMFRNYKLFYIMGSDNLKEFYSWKRPEKIFELTNLVVYRRNNDDMVQIINKNPILSKNISKIHIFDSKHNNLSSTLVRSWLKNKNVQISGRYLPRKVFDYIKEHKLYEINS